MKKITVLVLSFCIVMSLFVTYAFGATSIETWSPTANFWGSYASGARLDGSAASNTSHNVANWNSVSDSSDFDCDGDGTSIKINANQRYFATVLPILEKNTDYKLSFKYYLPEGVSKALADGYMRNIGISLKGTELSGSGNNITPTSFVQKGGNMDGATGNWNEYSIEFSTGENTEFVFGGNKLSAKNNGVSYFILYFDEFSLVEVNSEFDFKSVFWGSYASGTKLDGSASKITSHNEVDWNSVSDSSDFDCDGDGTSIKINANQRYFATVLPTLEKNTDYKLSFKYYLPEGVSKALDDGYMRNIGISLKGTTLSGSGNNITPTDFVKKGGNMDGATGNWNEYSIEFSTGENTEFVFGGNKLLAKNNGASYFLLYFDEFSLVEVENENYYETATNWHFYDKGLAIGEGTNADEKWYDITTSKTIVHNDGESSIKINAHATAIAIKLKDIEIGKKYDLTLHYYLPKTTTSSSLGTWMSGVGIYKKGTTIGNNGAINKNIPAIAGGPDTKVGEVTSGIAGNESWNSYTLTFEVTEESGADLYFAFRCAFASGFDIYLDDFAITENQTVIVPDSNFYDDAKSWGIYHTNTVSVIDGTGPQENDWVNITTNTDPAFTYNGTGSSVKYNGNISFMATKLKDLQQGEFYKVSFKYFAPVSSTMGASAGAWCSELGIYSEGTAINTSNNRPVSAVQRGIKFSGPSGQWNEFSMLFRATSTDLYFGINPAFASGFVIYIDDFTIQVDRGKEPQNITVIDFDNFGGNAEFEQKDRMEIIEAECYDGTKSKMLHFIKGEYKNPALLNYNSTYMADSDPIFTVGVKPNKAYTFAFRSKVDSTKDFNATWHGFYACYNQEYLARAFLHDDPKDEWVLHSYTIVTSSTQNAISIYANMGELTSSIWIDDISIKAIESGVSGNADDLSYCENDYNLFEKENVVNQICTNKSTVIKVPVSKNQWYTFGITVYSNERSNSKVFLSFDGVNPMPLNVGESASPIIFSNGKKGRYGINFFTDNYESVYLIIENNDKTLSFAEPVLFTQFSLSTNLELGKNEPPIESMSDVNFSDSSDNLLLIGDEEMFDSPQTGDKTVLPTVLICFTLLIFCFILLKTRKGAGKYEKNI